MNRVYCYADGFNLYHSIVDLANKSDPPYNRLKWLDLRKLFSLFIGRDPNAVFYFSALCKHHDANKQLRQKRFIKALEARGVEITLGKFKRKFPKCKLCYRQYTAYEEKQSDINIAIAMLQHAFENRFDEALLLTADTDLVAVVKKIKTLFPSKQIVLLVPPDRRKFAAELIGAAHRNYDIKRGHLLKSLLDNPVIAPNKERIYMPKEYE
jgi:uncharacterized LabA/DUF88 family protein